jgi:anaerobic selenocysteine-containing dehydrogenase
MTETATYHTTCVLDCPDGCGLEVTVETDASGQERILALEGRPSGPAPGEHPTTAGFLCAKVGQFHRRVHHRERILYPMRRRTDRSGAPLAKGEGGLEAFERISWDEALDTIAERLGGVVERWGGEAVVPYNYGGSNGLLSDSLFDDYFFARLGASRLQKTLCALPTGAAAEGLYGKMPGVAYEDYEAARFILIWGANPKVSGIHLVPFLKRAKAAGAFIAVVDPLRTFSDREIDLHLPVYPGTDLAVALAMIRLWQESGALDREFLAAHGVGLEPLLAAAQEWTPARAAAVAGIPEADLRTLAERYAATDPAVVRCGWGIERNRNGGAAAAAVLAMPALLGKFGVPGGGFTMSNGSASHFDRRQLLPQPAWTTRSLNMTPLGDLLAGRGAEGQPLDPPIQALFVYNCNPVATVPDQNGVLRGLARRDLFTVVSEQVFTDTAPFADILLPATTFLEQHDVRVGYGSYMVGGIRPVIAPRGEAWPNHRLFAALSQRMGWDEAAFHYSDEELVRRTAAALEMPGGAVQRGDGADRLLAGDALRYDFPGPTPVQMKTVSPRTADGKIHLTPAQLGDRPYAFEPLESPYPLALLSPGSPRLLTSTCGEFNLDRLTLTLHPEDAVARGLEKGAMVRVFNDLGEVLCPLAVSDRLRPGVALMPKGAWRRASKNAATSTALCPATVQRVAGGACYSDARVEVEAWAAPVD